MKSLIEYDLQQRRNNLPSMLKNYVFNFYKKTKESKTVENVSRRMTDIMNTNTQECFNFLFKSKVPEKECLLKEKIFGEKKTSWIMSSFDYLNKNNQPFTDLYFMKDCNHPVLSVPSDYEKLKSKKYLMIFTSHTLMFLKWEKVLEDDHINNKKSSQSMKKKIVQFKVDNTLGGLINDDILNLLKKRFLSLIHTYVTSDMNESLETFDRFFSKPACFTLNEHASCANALSFSCIKAEFDAWQDREDALILKKSPEMLVSPDDEQYFGYQQEIIDLMKEVLNYLTDKKVFHLKKISCESFYRFISMCSWFSCVVPFQMYSKCLTFFGTTTVKDSDKMYGSILKKKKEHVGQFMQKEFVEKFNKENKLKGTLFSIVELKDLPCWQKSMRQIVNNKRKKGQFEDASKSEQDNDQPKNQIKRFEPQNNSNKVKNAECDKGISKIETPKWIAKLNDMGIYGDFKDYYLTPVMTKLGLCFNNIKEKSPFIDCLKYSTECRNKFQNLCFNEFLVILSWNLPSFIYYREMTEEELILCMSLNIEVMGSINNPSKDIGLYHSLKTEETKVNEFKYKEQEDQIMRLLKLDGLILKNIECQNESICEAAIKSNPLSFVHVKNQTETLCKLSVESNATNFRHVKNKTNELCEYLMTMSSIQLEHAPKQFLTEENVIRIMNSHEKTTKFDRINFHKILNSSQKLSDETVIKIINKYNLMIQDLNSNVVNKNIMKHVLIEECNINNFRLIKQLDNDDILWVLERNGEIIQEIEKPTQKQIETAIKKNPLALQYIKIQNQTSDLCKLAFSLDKSSIKYAFKQDKQMCEEAFEHDPLLISYLKHQTKEMCEKAIEANVDSYNDLKFKTEKINMAYLKKYPSHVKQMSSISEDIKKMLFEMDKKLLRYFEDQSEDMVKQLLENDPLQLKYMNFRTREIENECFLKNMNVFPHVIEKSKEMTMKALEHNPMFLRFVENQTKEQIDFALSKDSRCIAFLKNQ